MSISKRALEELDSALETALKRHRPVISWLNNLLPSPTLTPSQGTESAPPPLDSSAASPPPFPSNRPQSLPPRLDSIRTVQVTQAAHYLDEEPQSSALIDNMSQEQRSGISERGSSRSPITMIKPSHSNYRSVLYHNYVQMDKTELGVSDDVKKGGAERNPEETGITAIVSRRPIWCGEIHDCLGRGGNSQWSTTALPYNSDYRIPLSAPKPDFHVGYCVGEGAPWSAQEASVIDHPFAQPYTQPAAGNSLPFFTLALRSEATGGTLWHAEDQAAGSGTYCVKAMQWLMQHAEPAGISSPADAVSFSVATNARHAVFYVHYYSPEAKAYVMSYLKSCMLTDPEDIQNCRNIVKNIMEYGLGVRLETLQRCLQKVCTQTDQWSNKRSASAAGVINNIDHFIQHDNIGKRQEVAKEIVMSQ